MSRASTSPWAPTRSASTSTTPASRTHRHPERARCWHWAARWQSAEDAPKVGSRKTRRTVDRPKPRRERERQRQRETEREERPLENTFRRRAIERVARRPFLAPGSE